MGNEGGEEMKLSKKSRYGLKALVDLAVNSGSGHVALYSIAERNGISAQYLEQVFAGLKKAGIIRSIKGPQGGYFLAEDPEQVTVASVIEALEGSYQIEEEKITESTLQPGISAAIQILLIDRVNQRMEEILRELTLADLVNHYLANRDSDGFMYYI